MNRRSGKEKKGGRGEKKKLGREAVKNRGIEEGRQGRRVE